MFNVFICVKQGLSIFFFFNLLVFRDNNVENINNPFSIRQGDTAAGKAANPQGPSGYGLQPRGWSIQKNGRKGGEYKGRSPEPLSREAVWGCCVGVGDELAPLWFEVLPSEEDWKALVPLLRSVLMRRLAPHCSTNERLDLPCSLETRIKLYQSTSPN